jgi:hypothetical protein
MLSGDNDNCAHLRKKNVDNCRPALALDVLDHPNRLEVNALQPITRQLAQRWPQNIPSPHYADDDGLARVVGVEADAHVAAG